MNTSDLPRGWAKLQTNKVQRDKASKTMTAAKTRDDEKNNDDVATAVETNRRPGTTRPVRSTVTIYSQINNQPRAVFENDK